jgi:cytochrome bd ubiquinol oxidase subunit II
MNPGPTLSLLSHAWFILIGIMLVYYVIADGFDLGVGILSLWRFNEADRDEMIRSIGDVWDANETWLVALGGALFGAFPVAYAILLSRLYIPVMALIASLIMRGAAIEFRDLATTHKRFWDRIFGLGSLFAAASQGVILGQIITGLGAGGLSVLFILLTAVGVVSGYALLGATWLVKKTSGGLEQIARRFSTSAAIVAVLCAILLSIGTLTITPVGNGNWTEPGIFHLLIALAIVAAAAFCYVLGAVHTGADEAPFNAAIVLFVASFLGLAISLFPYIVPGQLTVYAAASDTTTLVFMLFGIGMLVPVMVGYNLYQYYWFRGKVAADQY